MRHSQLIFILVVYLGALSIADSACSQDPLAHRKSDVTVRVEDANGNPFTDAILGVRMTQHAFKFGTQVRDRFFSITESEFNSLNESQRRSLMPDLSDLGLSQHTPTWQDAENYRAAVLENFNHIVPTVGMQWTAFNNNGPTRPDAAINLAQENGLSVTGASVVWQRDRWPTPDEFRSASNPDPHTFHDALISDRLSETGIMARYSDSGVGPTINDWKVLNEPLHENYYASTFVDAGIYNNQLDALTGYFVRADGIRPDATLSINEFNIVNSGGDAAAIAYRDLINNLLANGAPIDRIGVQAHISRTDVTKADIVRRLDILAETGLGIEITEFDSRDDASQLTPAQQTQIFEDILEASFEHESVDGFIMWGIWDPGHWRGNGPLYDEDWNIKNEASPWFDLVRGEWMPNLTGLTLNEQGEWIAPTGLFNGDYELTLTINGEVFAYDGFQLNGDAAFLISVPEPGATGLFFLMLLASAMRRRKPIASSDRRKSVPSGI